MTRMRTAARFNFNDARCSAMRSDRISALAWRISWYSFVLRKNCCIVDSNVAVATGLWIGVGRTVGIRRMDKSEDCFQKKIY